jgi:hypothetical protein
MSCTQMSHAVPDGGASGVAQSGDRPFGGPAVGLPDVVFSHGMEKEGESAGVTPETSTVNTPEVIVLSLSEKMSWDIDMERFNDRLKICAEERGEWDKIYEYGHGWKKEVTILIEAEGLARKKMEERRKVWWRQWRTDLWHALHVPEHERHQYQFEIWCRTFEGNMEMTEFRRMERTQSLRNAANTEIARNEKMAAKKGEVYHPYDYKPWHNPVYKL